MCLQPEVDRYYYYYYYYYHYSSYYFHHRRLREASIGIKINNGS